MSTKSNWVYSVLGVDRKVGGNNNNVAQNNTDDNFFTKKAHSIGNTVGTTISAPVSLVRDIGENIATYKFLGDSKSRMNDVAKKYGYNTYHDIWDARDKAEAEGDTATLDFIDNTINPELQAQANANAKEATDRAKGYEDYRKNNLISKNINQDNAKYLGSAINTLSTGFDVMSMAAGIPNGPVSNAVQGAVEGFADELERNGGNVDIFSGEAKNWDNFDIGRAGQNAAIGAAAGAATGALNKLAPVKNFGNGKISQAVLNSSLGNKMLNNAVGRGIRAVGTGAARGALSGAVGGAVGSGLSSAMNGVELGQGIANTLQGAGEGAKSGAVTGGVMAGANLAANAALNRVAPKTMEKVRANQARNAEYGDTIREQWDNAWKDRNSADTEVNMANNTVSGVPTSIANETAGDGSWRDLDNMVDRSIAEAMPSADIAQVKDTVLENVANKLQSSGVFDSYEAGEISDADYRNYAMAAINDSVSELANQPSARPVAQTQIETTSNTQLSPWDRVAQESGYASYDDAIRSFQLANPDVKLGANDAGRILTWMDDNPGNWNPNMPKSTVIEGQDVDTDLTYGNSKLGSKKKTFREKIGLALERSQVNATRKEMRDIGIENAGDLVDNVRQRTGLTDIEDQASFAKEITGGKNSLLDTIQNDALSTNDDGSIRRVDLTDLEPQIRKIVDDAPDTLVSPKKKQEILSGIQRELTNPGVNAVQKANDMRASASELYTKNAKTPDKADIVEGKIYSDVAGLVEDKIYGVIPKKNVNWMYDKAIAESNGRAKQLMDSGNEKYAKAYTNLANDLANSERSIKNFRSLKKDFVDINKLATKTSQGNTAWNNNALTLGTAMTAAALSGNPLTAIPTAAAAKLLAPAIGEATTKGAAKLGGKIVDWGRNSASITTPTNTATSTPVASSSYNPATQIYNMIGRDAGERQGEEQRVAQYLTEAQKDQTIAGNTLEGLVAPLGASTSSTGGASTSVYNSVYGTPATTMSYEEERAKYFYPPTGDYWTDMISQAMRNAKNAEDYDALGSLYEMYMDAVEKNEKANSSTSEVKLTDKQRQANAAERALEDFAQEESNFAYDVSDIPILGNIANLGGNTYRSKAEALALQIGYMLSGATVNKEEAKNIGMAYVPQPRDSEAVRKSKLDQLRGIISDYQRTYAE